MLEGQQISTIAGMSSSCRGDIFCGDKFALERLHSSHAVFA
jgi:hypothetical protein